MKNQLKSFILVLALSFNAQASYYDNALEYMNNYNALLFDIEINGVTVGDACATFMNENHTLGALGKFIYNEVKTNGATKYPELMGSSAIDSICPRYSNMNSGEKAEIITLLLTTMAHFESTCNSKALQKAGPNGNAIGLYQLHQNREDIYDGAAKHCIKNSGYKSQESSVCALSMLNLQIKNRGVLFSPKSYWDILRPQGPASRHSKAPQRIQKAIQNMHTCK